MSDKRVIELLESINKNLEINQKNLQSIENNVGWNVLASVILIALVILF